jgi:hypothetical protein
MVPRNVVVLDFVVHAEERLHQNAASIPVLASQGEEVIQRRSKLIAQLSHGEVADMSRLAA